MELIKPSCDMSGGVITEIIGQVTNADFTSTISYMLESMGILF